MEFVELGWDRQMGDVPIGFLPSDLANLELWTRFNSGITVTGSGVSQWDDQSGNGNHLLQGTDANRPSKEADGSILGDGLAHFLKAGAFTLAQPYAIYLLINPVSWTDNDCVFDGNTLNTGALYQRVATPAMDFYAGTAFAAANSDLVVGSYGAMVVVGNGASSLIQVGNNAPTTGNPGTSAMGGFTLASRGDGVSWSNIQVKEVLIYSEAHDAVTRAKVIAYLQSI